MHEQQGRLNVSGLFETTDIRVVDDSHREIASGIHNVDRSLHAGIYRVLAKVPGASLERLVVVEPGRTTTVDDLDLAWDSVTPHSRSRSRSDVHTAEAVAVSRRTHVKVGRNPKGRLFLFVRACGEPPKSPVQFRIADDGGETIACVPEQGDLDLEHGWTGISIELPSGIYQVEHDVRKLGRRSQALFVEDGWETQIFAPWDEDADFASAVAYMRPHGSGFEPDKFWEYARVEAALDGLLEGRLVVNATELDRLVRGVCADPMLSLIGGYALLIGGSVDYDRLATVAGELKSVVPSSPDALLMGFVAELRGADLRFRHTGLPSFRAPPIFCIGAEHVIKLAAQSAQICPATSWLGRVSLALATGSAWTRWDARVDAAQAMTALRNEIIAYFEENSARVMNRLNRSAESSASSLDAGLHREQLSEAVQQVVSMRQRSRAGASVAPGRVGSQTLDLFASELAGSLAPEFALPRAVVFSAMSDVLRSAMAHVQSAVTQSAPSTADDVDAALPRSVRIDVSSERTHARTLRFVDRIAVERARIVAGVNLLANAVKVTLGPRVRNVAI